MQAEQVGASCAEWQGTPQGGLQALSRQENIEALWFEVCTQLVTLKKLHGVERKLSKELAA